MGAGCQAQVLGACAMHVLPIQLPSLPAAFVDGAFLPRETISVFVDFPAVPHSQPVILSHTASRCCASRPLLPDLILLHSPFIPSEQEH